MRVLFYALVGVTVAVLAFVGLVGIVNPAAKAIGFHAARNWVPTTGVISDAVPSALIPPDTVVDWAERAVRTEDSLRGVGVSGCWRPLYAYEYGGHRYWNDNVVPLGWRGCLRQPQAPQVGQPIQVFVNPERAHEAALVRDDWDQVWDDLKLAAVPVLVPVLVLWKVGPFMVIRTFLRGRSKRKSISQSG